MMHSHLVPIICKKNLIYKLFQIGFGSHVEKFRHCQVDGDLLLRITDEDLVDSIKIESTLGRKRYALAKHK